MFSVLLRHRFEPKTWAPLDRAYSAMWLPTKPVMPVIRIRMPAELPKKIRAFARLRRLYATLQSAPRSKTARRGPVEVGRLSGHARRREALLHAPPSCLPHRRPSARLGEQIAHGPPQRPMIVGRDEEARHAFFHHVHVARRQRGGHGEPHGHGLEDGQGQPLFAGGRHIEIHGGEHPRSRERSGPSPMISRWAVGSAAAARAKARSRASSAFTGSKRATVPSTRASRSSPRTRRVSSRGRAEAAMRAASMPLTMTWLEDGGARPSVAASRAWLSETCTMALVRRARRRSTAR